MKSKTTQIDNFVTSAYTDVQLLTDEGNQMHRRAVRGKCLVVHVHGWDRHALGGNGGNAVTLRIDGQYMDRGSRETFPTTQDANNFAAAVAAYLLNRLPPVPIEFDYTPEQQHALNEAAEQLIINLSNPKFTSFVDIDRSGVLHRRDNELFAVFGTTAYKLLNTTLSDERAEFEYVPAIINGALVGEFPEEGHSGVLHLMRCLWRKNSDGSLKPGYPSKWSGTYLSGGWLRTEELCMTNADVLQNIADEIDDGATHLTGGRPGWA